MKWFAWIAGAGLLVLASVKGNILPTNKNCGPLTESLTIKKIARNDVSIFDVCCDPCPTQVENGKYLLGITDVDDNQKIYDSISESTGCVEYAGEIDYFSGENSLKIAMQYLGEDNCPIAGYLVTIDSFPDFSVSFTFAIGTNPDTSETGITDIIRVEGNMGSFTFPDLDIVYEVSSSSEEVTYYFINRPTPPPTTPLTPCYVTNGVQICDASIPEGSATYEGDIIPKSATLKYDTLLSASFVADMTSVTPPAATFDMIHISDKDPHTLCENKVPALLTNIITCNVEWSPGDKVADFRLVKIAEDGLPSGYEKIPIQDRELLSSPIGTSSIEARWLFMGDVEKLYKMTLSEESLVPVNDRVINVDCSGVSSDYCFGYFTDNSPNKYRITIQSKISGNYDPYTQIQSNEIEITARRELPNELNVNVSELEWQQESKARTTICFNHKNPSDETSFSHYEFVILNNKGQWLKHKNVTQDLRGNNCFAPLHISTETFDVSEGATLIVTQRAVDGFTVLAEGETHLDFNRT